MKQSKPTRFARLEVALNFTVHDAEYAGFTCYFDPGQAPGDDAIPDAPELIIHSFTCDDGSTVEPDETEIAAAYSTLYYAAATEYETRRAESAIP
jgi:hypothetical protein